MLLLGDNEKDRSLESADLTRLEDSCKRFRKSLINFIDMYYNKRLSILLSDMENQAKVRFRPLRTKTFN